MINCSVIESQYKSYINQIGANHSDTLLEHFVKKTDSEVCPEHHEVTYINGKLQCSVHNKNSNIDNENDYDDTVPFL